MNASKYKEEAVKLAIYPEIFWDSYLPLQLASEAGEVAAEFAKPQRKFDVTGVIPPSYNRDNIGKELGDVLWYVANIADRFGYTLEELFDINIAKLKERRGIK